MIAQTSALNTDAESSNLMDDFWQSSTNECLTTPQHEKQVGYWVSGKGKCMKWLYH